MGKKKSKKKITDEERVRRAIQGYAAIGNIDRNFIIG